MVIGFMGSGAIRLKKNSRVLESDEKMIQKIWRKILKTVLAKSECMIRKVLSNIITAN